VAPTWVVYITIAGGPRQRALREGFLSRLWLIGIGAIFAALLGAGVGLAITLERSRGLLPPDRPEGVVQRFLMAVEDGRFEEAYAYLTSESQSRCSLQDFTAFTSTRRFAYDQGSLSLGRVEVSGDEATVWVRHESDGPFETYAYEEPFRLTREGGQWRINAHFEFRPGPYWCPPGPLPTATRP